MKKVRNSVRVFVIVDRKVNVKFNVDNNHNTINF